MFLTQNFSWLLLLLLKSYPSLGFLKVGSAICVARSVLLGLGVQPPGFNPVVTVASPCTTLFLCPSPKAAHVHPRTTPGRLPAPR